MFVFVFASGLSEFQWTCTNCMVRNAVLSDEVQILKEYDTN